MWKLKIELIKNNIVFIYLKFIKFKENQDDYSYLNLLIQRFFYFFF